MPEPAAAVLPLIDVAAAAFSPFLASAALTWAGTAAVAAGAPAMALADVNLIPNMQPIRDQGTRGTCVAHACLVAAMEHFYRTQRGQALDFSEQFLFCLSKQNDGYPQLMERS